MGDSTLRSPLGHYVGAFESASARSGGELRIAEAPFWQQLNLRLDAESGPVAAVEAVLGTALPREPNTTTAASGRRILWLGPDEWLILSPPSSADDLEQRLRSAAMAVPGHASIVDVSSLRTIVEVSGSGARAMLAQGCALDLHPCAFAVDRCAQTRFAQANVILLAVAADRTGARVDHVSAPVFWILVRASFAEYLAAFMLDVMN